MLFKYVFFSGMFIREMRPVGPDADPDADVGFT